MSKPPLDPDDLIDWVVQSAPFPDKYSGDPSASTLGSLGVNAGTAGLFVQGIQDRIKPWFIDSNDVAAEGNTLVGDCADSVNDNAY
jgi:hypothetical protein